MRYTIILGSTKKEKIVRLICYKVAIKIKKKKKKIGEIQCMETILWNCLCFSAEVAFEQLH